MEENEVIEQSPEVSQPQQQQQSDAEKNFAALRQAKQKAERERDEYQQKLAQMEAAQKPQERSRNNDDLAEWGDIQKVKQELDSKLQEIKLRTDHPDIYNVVSQDNIDKLRAEDPELAQMIYDTQFQDPAKAMKMAYKYIKKMGIQQPAKDYSKENDLIESNQAKPKSSASATRATPLSQANEYMATSYKEKEAHNRRVFLEMQEAAANKY